jgi:spore coat protein A
MASGPREAAEKLQSANLSGKQLNRRVVIRNSLCAATCAALAARIPAFDQAMSQMATTQSDKSGINLTPYVDSLTIPPVIDSTSMPGKIIEIQMRQFQRKVHRDLPATTLWGFNGAWPGPTIMARRGQQTIIRWTNRLPSKHFLPIDHTLHGAESTLPEVRTVTHLHGARVLPESDGYPEAWYTADGQHGPRFNPLPSTYPNDQPAATLWYHDHCHGITRLNTYAGLAGFYLIRDEAEEALKPPSGEFDIPLMLQDRLFNKDGSLLYPKAVNGTHPVWVQEFYGDMNCVNGTVMPYLDVEPRKYRFRLLNASNTRFYNLRLYNADHNGNILDKSFEVPFLLQIGSDCGLMAAPVEMRYLLISPGERIDFVVDFADSEGKFFSLESDALTVNPMEGEVAPAVPPKVLLFKVVKPLSSKDTSSVPGTLIPFEPIVPTSTTRERMLWITEKVRASDDYVEIGLLGNAHWSDPITEDPRAGSTEIWSFVNATQDVHPIHIHLVHFQVLNRQRFDISTFLATGKVMTYGPPVQPERNERLAVKDTVKAYPGFVTRVIQRFDLPRGSKLPPGSELHYVWHCHILEHEDNDMMRPYKVLV